MTINRDLIDRARAVDILAIAQRFGAKLKRAGTEHIGPCPVCGGSDRFSVNTNKRVFNCRGCGKGGDVIKLVTHVTGCDFGEAVETLAGGTMMSNAARVQHLPAIAEHPTISKVEHALLLPPPRRAPFDASDNAAAAGRIWRASVPIVGTVAEAYLVCARAIDIAQIPDIDDVLRFHPRCPFGPGTQLPCLIALVRDVITDAPMAITRTALTAGGRKIDRKALGPKQGGAIKLWSDASVSAGLCVGEGAETVLGGTRVEHKGTLLQPAWALIDAGNLSHFPVLPGIKVLTILADHDALDPKTGKRPGQYAARQCAQRWRDAGREVVCLLPDRLGDDFNDVAREAAR